jgi:hypothetical protein
MTTIQASFYYGKSVSTIYKWIKEGKLIAIKVNRVWKIKGLAPKRLSEKVIQKNIDALAEEFWSLAKKTKTGYTANLTRRVGNRDTTYKFTLWEKNGIKILFIGNAILYNDTWTLKVSSKKVSFKNEGINLRLMPDGMYDFIFKVLGLEYYESLSKLYDAIVQKG